MHISIPKHASDIIKTLSAHGYEAYVVGGCVRDSILGKEPADWDITTSALPEQVKALFPRTIDTGLKHGTVTIMMDKVGYEVTTYRIDGTNASKKFLPCFPLKKSLIPAFFFFNLFISIQSNLSFFLPLILKKKSFSSALLTTIQIITQNS